MSWGAERNRSLSEEEMVIKNKKLDEGQFPRIVQKKKKKESCHVTALYYPELPQESYKVTLVIQGHPTRC
jgi:hypothetical protein